MPVFPPNRLRQASALHDCAMASADDALAARARGEAAEAERLFRFALADERAAADLVVGVEPSRSVLLRSAACLALQCSGLGEDREAEQLIALGLAGDPPAEIADELRALMLSLPTWFSRPALPLDRAHAWPPGEDA